MHQLQIIFFKELSGQSRVVDLAIHKFLVRKPAWSRIIQLPIWDFDDIIISVGLIAVSGVLLL